MDLLFNDSGFNNLVIQLNREKQLYEKGIDSKGNSLGEYSPLTVYMKLFFRNPVQVVDRVTLKDTGEFYKTFKTIQLPNGDIQIYANTLKDGVDLKTRYGDIIGITDDNLNVLINTAKK